MRIISIGDPQIGNPQQESFARKKIAQLKRETIGKDDILLIPGDLTDSGQNNNFLNKAFYTLFSCCHGSKVVFPDHLDQFINLVHNPLKQLFSNRVYICHGNHDESGFPKKPVMDYVKKTHGALDYCVPVGDNLVLICLGKCYTPSKREMLEKWLDQNKNSKIIIMQHYYIQGPSQWDFWDDNHKKEFINIVTPYKTNIVCIVEGHLHATYTKYVSGILFVNGSGQNYVSVNFE